MDFENSCSLDHVSDDELLLRLGELVSRSRRVEVDLVAHIGEVDARRLYARQAFGSMFAYCTEHLHLSEAEAYRRITVARAARKHPAILEFLRDGRVPLSGLARLVPMLTASNLEGLLERATHRTTRQIEALVAELAPRPDVPATMRKLPGIRPAPQPTAAAEPSFLCTAPVPERSEVGRARDEPDSGRVEVASGAHEELVARRVEAVAVVQPLAPARFKVQFTASAELRDKLQRLSALMRSEVPDGDLAAVIESAVTEKLERIEARRFGKAKTPRTVPATTVASTASRHIPAAVRRTVHVRDEGRCRFVDASGRRCSETRWLEFHHRHPFAMGGDHSVANVSLLCREHNRRMAERDFGEKKLRHNNAPRPPAPTSAG